MEKDKRVTIGPARWAVLKAFCAATRTLAIYDPVSVQCLTSVSGTLVGVQARYQNSRGQKQVDHIAKKHIVSLRFYGR